MTLKTVIKYFEDINGYSAKLLQLFQDLERIHKEYASNLKKAVEEFQGIKEEKIPLFKMLKKKMSLTNNEEEEGVYDGLKSSLWHGVFSMNEVTILFFLFF